MGVLLMIFIMADVMWLTSLQKPVASPLCFVRPECQQKTCIKCWCLKTYQSDMFLCIEHEGNAL